MTPNVTHPELYDALIGVETRLGGKIDALASEVRTQNQHQAEQIATLEQCGTEYGRRLGLLDGSDGAIATLDAKVDELRGTDRRWGAAGAILGPLLGALTGWLAGQR